MFVCLHAIDSIMWKQTFHHSYLVTIHSNCFYTYHMEPLFLSNIRCMYINAKFSYLQRIRYVILIVVAYYNFYGHCCSQALVCLGVLSIDREQPQNNDTL